MNNKTQTSADIQKELDELLERKAFLTSEISSFESTLQTLKSELADITGGMLGLETGRIGKCMSRLERQQRIESDANKPTVVWSNNRFPGPDCVVRKVTSKRIFVCRAGSTRCRQFLLNGESATSYKGYRINIQETFGIDSDEVPPNWTSQQVSA